ncbi:MAG: hypothetical protein WDZ74_01975 [Candidatus Paceibacterota bacterium]
MNKNILIALLLILLVLAAYYLFGREREIETVMGDSDSEETRIEDEENREEVKERSDRTEVRERLDSMTVDVPDVDTFATLSGGEVAFDAGAGVEGYLNLGKAYTLVSNGEVEFALIHATISTGGSGTFDYVFAVRVTDDALTHTGSAYVGDRIIVEGIDAEPRTGGGFDVSVLMLTRVDGEPLSALPTVPVTLEFSLSEDGEFGE